MQRVQAAAEVRQSAEYQRKLKSAAAAVEGVSSGNRIVVGHAAGEPSELLDALWEQRSRLTDVELVHMIALGSSHYCKPEAVGHFRHNSLFAGPGSRKAIAEGRADYTPVYFSDIPRLFRDEILPVDVAFVQVAPPDKEGMCSFGVSVDYTAAATKAAKYVVAEINPRMPRTYDSALHISEIDAIVEVDHPLLEVAPIAISKVEERIGELVASLVPDRANLQLGIGGIPDALLKFLGNKKDLGIFTEMFSDGVVDLVRSGVITNRYNNLHPGLTVATFLVGSPKLYDFANENRNVLMRPVDYTNRITIAGNVERLMSINSAIQIDLMGQVCADSVGPMQYSGPGGQIDFVRATSLSPGGKSIIAMPSTAKNNTVSKIVPRLDPGAAVTTPRNDVHFVATEFGIADLRGKSLRARARALIEISHPDFRRTLTENATELGML